MSRYLEDKNLCCGCGACENVCPSTAITMQYDEEGFIYPKLNASKCTDCRACERVCPAKTDSEREYADYLKTYAGYSTQKEIMENCASGGFATALSNLILQKDGVVFGVRYSEDFIKSEYFCATNQVELQQLYSSKYVQSEKKDVYKLVKNTLKLGKTALFIGCPCDVAGLKLFLAKEYDNLYTVELVCMGVTSYKIAEEYKNYTEKKNKSKLVAINARSKKNGWFVPHLEERFENSKVKITPLFASYYGYGFQTYNRPSCYNCKYRDKNGVADFRIGDFWGIKDTDEFWNPKGVSCIFVRTEKGNALLKDLRENGFELFETDYRKATVSNMSSYKNKDEKYLLIREKFSKVFLKKGLVPACKQTATLSFRLKRIIPKKMQASLKKIYHKFVDKK